VSFDHLICLLTNLKKVAFSGSQETENDFKVPFDNGNNRFNYFTQIAFWAGQEAENKFAVPYKNFETLLS